MTGKPILDGGAQPPPIKRFRRYLGYGYSRGAAMFITIVTAPRRACFGKVVDSQVHLTPLGETVDQAIRAMPTYNPALRLFSYVVMPDHIHLDLHIEAGHDDALQLIGAAVRKLKTWTTTVMRRRGECGGLWQQGYHDRLCSTRDFFNAVLRYIKYNPLKYELRHNHPAYLAIHEPMESTRLSPEEFWRGLGNPKLLDAGKMMAVRISRKVPSAEFPRLVMRFLKGAAEGWVFIGGWISPGEKTVRDALLASANGRIVQILPSMMPHDYMPSNLYFEALHGKRALIIARGNDEIEFDRAACLDLNKTATGMADRAVYIGGDGAPPSRVGIGGDGAPPSRVGIGGDGTLNVENER